MGEQDDTSETPPAEAEEEEEELDEAEQRKQRLRERMARLAGPQGGGFNPFGAPMPSASAPKKRTSARKPTEEGEEIRSPQEEKASPAMPQMVAIPGMGGAPPVPAQRVQSPESGGISRKGTEEMEEEGAPAPPSRQSTQEERTAPEPPRRSMTGERPMSGGEAPPVPKGELSAASIGVWEGKRKPWLRKRKSFAMLFRKDSGASLHGRSKSQPVNGGDNGCTDRCGTLRGPSIEQKGGGPTMARIQSGSELLACASVASRLIWSIFYLTSMTLRRVMSEHVLTKYSSRSSRPSAAKRRRGSTSPFRARSATASAQRKHKTDSPPASGREQTRAAATPARWCCRPATTNVACPRISDG